MTNIQKGKYAENLAEKYLKKLEYKILCKNWTCHWGELDIIAKKNFRITIFEVKYKTTPKFGEPFEAVTKAKLSKLYRSIQIFLRQNNMYDFAWQLDVLAISNWDSKLRLRHFKAVGFD